MPSNYSSNLLAILDEFGYQLRAPTANQPPETDMYLLGSLFLVQAAFCFLLNTACFVYLFLSHKHEHNSKYLILRHYFACKLAFTVVLCVSLLMSSVFYDTPFHIASSRWLCRLEFFGDMFMTTCENYLLFFLWLILLAERQLIGFKHLNSQQAVLPESTSTPTWSWCRNNSRAVVLVRKLWMGLMFILMERRIDLIF